MNSLPRQKLCEVIAAYGRALCDDPRRCEGLLRDLCGEHRREIFVLINAVRERVAADLLSSQGSAPNEVLLARLTKRLEDNLALARDAARWAVESWAMALAVIPYSEAEAMEADSQADSRELTDEHQLRTAVRTALTNGRITDEEKAKLEDVRQRLDIPVNLATRTYAEVIQETPAIPSLQWFEFGMDSVDRSGKTKHRSGSKARSFTQDLGGGVTLEMVAIPGGTFWMGSPDTEAERLEYEGPQHRVAVSPFFLGRCPITQAQWRVVAGLPQFYRPLNSNPSHFEGEDRPVENVSWYDCQEFCARLSCKTGRAYRLPSEAEWEYACRAGTTTPFHFGDSITTSLANYDGTFPYTLGYAPKGTYRRETTSVGLFLTANAFGLYDMHGNVEEWCADPWHPTYLNAPSEGKAWEAGGDGLRRVKRGGSWYSTARGCRSAFRSYALAGKGSTQCGFRVALSIPQTS